MPLTLLRAALLVGTVAAPASAHDFWLQPERFQVEAGQSLDLSLLVGHGEARQRSPLPRERITRFDGIGPDGAADLRPTLHLGEPQGDATLRLDAPGPHLLAFETNGKLSELPARRFDDYVAAEGLTLVAEDRLARAWPGAPGTEIYSRCAKSVLAVEPAAGAASVAPVAPVTRPVGLTLEIVPEADPAGLAPGDPLSVTVLLRDEALAGALVKLTDLNDDAEPVDVRRTDAAGRAALTIPREGDWLLNVVWSVPLPEGRDADYLTVFSSLSFAVTEAGDAGL